MFVVLCPFLFGGLCRRVASRHGCAGLSPADRTDANHQNLTPKQKTTRQGVPSGERRCGEGIHRKSFIMTEVIIATRYDVFVDNYCPKTAYNVAY